MAVAEDAAMVLEQFVQDVANLPAEIAHLLEEIQAKDKIIHECRSVISARDNSIQKFVRINGSLAPNPKEEPYARTILANYDRAQVLQEEKVGLSEKAGVLLDRHIRRLDVKIRDLQNEGTMPLEPPLPSLLHASPANRGSMASTPVTGASTPLNPISSNAAPSTTIANSDITRLAHPPPAGQRPGSPAVMQAGPQHGRPFLGGAPAHMSSSAPTTPAATAILQQRQRETSAGAINDAKRRRLNAHLGSLPQTSSGLARPSSLGPGTPKPGTPGGTVRAGSAGPGRGSLKKQPNKKVAPHQQIRKKLGSKAGLVKKTTKKLANGGIKRSPTSTDDERSVVSETASEDDASTPPPRPAAGGGGGGGGGTEGSKQRPTGDGDDDVAMPDRPAKQQPGDGVAGDGDAEAEADPDPPEPEPEDEDGGDDRKYCTCRNVSYGDMVACDNDDCPFEWFHWQCVGMTKEPIGKWFCGECRAKLGLAGA